MAEQLPHWDSEVLGEYFDGVEVQAAMGEHLVQPGPLAAQVFADGGLTQAPCLQEGGDIFSRQMGQRKNWSVHGAILLS